eukprot:5066954-Pyramimonas_sp.AAC.1
MYKGVDRCPCQRHTCARKRHPRHASVTRTHADCRDLRRNRFNPRGRQKCVSLLGLTWTILEASWAIWRPSSALLDNLSVLESDTQMLV